MVREREKGNEKVYEAIFILRETEKNILGLRKRKRRKGKLNYFPFSTSLFIALPSL